MKPSKIYLFWFWESRYDRVLSRDEVGMGVEIWFCSTICRLNMV